MLPKSPHETSQPPHRCLHILLLYAVIAASGLLLLSGILRGQANAASLVHKQCAMLCVGCSVIALCLFLPTKWLKSTAPWGLLLCYASLWLLLFFGESIHGARSWFHVFGCHVQPSELFKPFFIIVTACAWDDSFQRQMSSHRRFWTLLLLCFAAVLPIMLQPDEGTAIIFLLTCLSMAIGAGCPWGLFAELIPPGIVAIAFLSCRYPHIHHRLDVFKALLLNKPVNPDHAYQVLQMQGCLIKGGWFGTLSGSPSGLHPLPLRLNDSYFAASAELIGVIGVIPIVLLCLLWFVFCCHLAAHAPSLRRRLFLIGAGTMLSGQAFLHIAVNLGLFPNTGVTLPLMSYGGSSIISTAIIIGLTFRLSQEENIPSTQNAPV